MTYLPSRRLWLLRTTPLPEKDPKAKTENICDTLCDISALCYRRVTFLSWNNVTQSCRVRKQPSKFWSHWKQKQECTKLKSAKRCCTCMESCTIFDTSQLSCPCHGVTFQNWEVTQCQRSLRIIWCTRSYNLQVHIIWASITLSRFQTCTFMIICQKTLKKQTTKI